jgi:hypothetical protein
MPITVIAGLKTSIALGNSTTSTTGPLTAQGLGCSQSTPFSSVLVTARSRDRSIPHPQSPTVFKQIPKNSNFCIVNYSCPGYGGRNQEACVSCPFSITEPCGVRRTQIGHVAPQQIEPDGLEFISPLTWRSMQLQLHTLHSL